MKSVLRKCSPRGLSVWTVAIAFAIISISPAQARHKPEEEQEVVEEQKEPDPPAFDLEYVSPLLKYKKYKEIKGPGWKESNDKVGEIGGWRVYAREAFEAEKAEEEPESDESDDQSDESGEEK